jgi:hypothetical protein
MKGVAACDDNCQHSDSVQSGAPKIKMSKKYIFVFNNLRLCLVKVYFKICVNIRVNLGVRGGAVC